MLKRAIVRCELTPGQHASENYLVCRYGLSRSATRSALNRLCQEELVQSIARTGHVVAPITVRRVREVFDLRSQLEPLSARRATESARDLSYLKDLDKRCRDARYEPGDHDAVNRFLQANTDLHVGVVAGSGNQLMADIVAGLLEESERFFHLALRLTDRNDEMYHEHHELIDALLSRDGDRAQALAATQIQASEAMVLSALMASPLLLEVNIAE